MKKASGIISLLLALLLISAGCFGALAQEPADPEGEVIVQEYSAQEAAEREAAEQEAGEADEPESVEQEAEEAAEQESADQAPQEAEEQETADQTVTEKEEKQIGTPADIPSECEETENSQDEMETEAQPAAEALAETEKQEADSTITEEPFIANISIELTNTGVIRLGDELQLKAVVDGANRTYAISWQNREQPASPELDPDWVQIETGETYQLTLTEAAAELEYRVLLTADNGQSVASGEYRLPEPGPVDEQPVEINPDTDSVPDAEKEEKDPLTGEAPSENTDQKETIDQEETIGQEEELVIIPEVSSENTDTPDEEDHDLELAWNEIIVVTETAPETPDESEGVAETPDENEEATEATDENEEAPENNSEEQPAPEEMGIDPQAPAETGEEPAATSEEEPQKERKVRVLSSRGETIVCGETIRMAVDLSDFEDCAQVSVVWEADKGSGWEEVGTGENFEYIADAESICWPIRARVRYML